MYPINPNNMYEPLQNTLRKSSVGNADPAKIANNLGLSKVSRKVRSLSPVEAQRILVETLPQQKQLVPTDHLWRVRGKQFAAIDVCVKQKQPIPSEIMRQRRPFFQQIVYEFQSPTAHTNQMHQLNRHSSQKLIGMTQNSSAMNIRYNPTLSTALNEYQLKIREPKPLQMLSRKPKSQILSPSSSQPIGLLNSVKTNKKNSKRKYKYNFFSAIDELVDTKCGSCGGNQIIASRPTNRQWK